MRLDRNKYISHIRDIDKQQLMKRIIDKIEKVLNSYTIESTDFLDPYERSLSKAILNSFDDLSYLEDGGLEEAERKIIYIFPSYMETSQIEEKLIYLRAKGEFQKLSHKDFLGGLLSIGIKREKTGDIIVHEDYADFILEKDIGGFVLLNLEKVGNQNIQISEVKKEELSSPNMVYKEITSFISSLRIDAFLSAVYNISRNDALNIIKAGHVKVNWVPIEKPSILLSQADLISTKGYGRAIIHTIGGLSKKGRVHVSVRIPI